MRHLVAILTALCLLAAGGCTHNLFSSDPNSLTKRMDTGSAVHLTQDGEVKAGYHGPSTGGQLDDAGIYFAGSGIHEMLAFPMGERMAYRVGPGDTAIDTISYTPEPAPGEPQLLIQGLQTDMSTPLEQINVALADDMEALIAMSEEERRAMVEQVQAISPAAANVLMTLIEMLGGL
jgi:hypothetical protein